MRCGVDREDRVGHGKTLPPSMPAISPTDPRGGPRSFEYRSEVLLTSEPLRGDFLCLRRGSTSGPERANAPTALGGDGR